MSGRSPSRPPNEPLNIAMNTELADAIRASSKRLGVEPIHLATAMSYETGGTFDPWKKGPTTKWGEHRGLIQWGEPQRAKYGVTQDMPITAQVEAAERYLKDAGVKPGMGLLDIYSAINAGGVGLYDRSDAAAGGAPGTVRDKVETQMADHKAKAAALLGGQDITVADRSPTRPITVPEQMAAEAAPGPGIGETAMAAAREHSLTGWLVTKPWLLPDDPDFQMTDERLKALTQGIPSDRWRAFENAYSADQADSIRRELLAQMDRQRTLSEAGITGALLSVGAAIGDPIGIGVGVATAGTGNAIMWGTKLSRMQRVLSAGVAGAAVNAGLAGVEENLKPNPEWDAVLLAGAGGAFMGAAFGALSKMPHMAPEAQVIRETSKEAVEKTEAKYGVEPLRPKDSSVGAAQGIEQVPLAQDANDFIRLADGTNAPKTGMAPVRFDATGRTKASENQLTRMLGNALGEDGTGNLDKDVPALWSATQERARLQQVMDTRRALAIEPHLKAWADARGLGPFAREKARVEFQKEVTRARRNQDPTRTFDPEVLKAVKDVGRWYDDYHTLAVDPGRAIGLPGQRRPVPGFDPTVPSLPNYVNRVISHTKLGDALRRYGHNGVADAFAAAMRQAQPDIDPKALHAISRGWLTTHRKVARGMEARAADGLFSNDLEGLRAALHDIPGVDPEAIENVMATMARPVDRGSVTRAKHRVLLDEGLRIRMPDGLETTIGELLLEEDIGKLMASYNHQMAGHVALSQVLVEKVVEGQRHLLIDGLAGPGKLEHYLQKMAAVADEIDQPQAALVKDQRRIEYLHKSAAGVPLHDHSAAYAQWLRLWREYGFVRVAGQIGFAQFPEVGAIFSSGFKAAMSSMPSLRALLRDVRTGKLKDEFAAELEGVFGRGAERIRTAGDWNLSTEGEFGTAFDRSPLMVRVERALGAAKRATMEISGLNAMNTWLHRWSTSAVVHWFSRAASGEITVPVERLRKMGLTDAMAERVLNQIKKHRTLKDGSSFKLARLNLDQWDDLEAAAHFERAVHVQGSRMVMTNSPGLLAPWMSHPVAATVLQFRTFVVAAHSKQMLHAMHWRDRESMSMFLGTMVAGQLGHIAQTVANAPMLSEKQLEERLSLQGIAMGGLQRTGMTALLPLLVDTFARAFGQPGVFNSRSTDQTSDLWFGNPTTGLADDIPKAMRALMAALADDRRMSRGEIRDILRPLIWQNTLPMVMLFGAMSRDLPDFAPKGR